MIDKFIAAMAAKDCGPAPGETISPDNQWHDYQICSDPVGKKKGYYIVSEFGGGFGDRRTGEWHSWKPKYEKTWSATEIKAWRERQEADRVIKEAARQAGYDEAAKLANQQWNTANSSPDHPYLKAKNIKPHNARRDIYGKLLIPLCWDGKIVNLQSISREGEKLFLKKGRKKGCFHLIGEITPVVLICEGFSTGATLHEATGYCVFVAFDAGNLKPVALTVRETHPELKIIVCADNDQWLRVNVGLEKGNEAAAAVGGVCVWHEFQPDDLSRPTDYNDLQDHDTIRSEILRAAATPEFASGNAVAVLETPAGDLIESVETEHLSPVFSMDRFNDLLLWKDRGQGKLERNSLANILVYLRHNEKFRGLLRHDKFTDRFLVYNCPSWENEEKFCVRKVSNEDYGYIEEALEREGLGPSPARVAAGMAIVAKENWINPPLDYFERIKWDGEPRLCSWIRKYLDADEQPAEYLSTIGTMWIIGGVARIYEPGCKNETMIVLEGKQGMGKSRALAILANIGATRHETESYFCDTLNFSKIQEKDTVGTLQGKLIVEFAELAKLGAREVEEVKSWMSVQIDEVRKAYGRESQIFPRQFILAGTTNEFSWMRDPSGGRRFWPVRCGMNFDLKGLEEVKDQLWAEAVHLYKNKTPWWIDLHDPLWKVAEIQQQARLREDVWAGPILDSVHGKEHVKVGDLLKGIGIEVSKQTNREVDRVCGILQAAGWVNKPVWDSFKRKTFRAWVNPSYIKPPIDEDGEEVPF